jgi:hypothetical protein
MHGPVNVKVVNDVERIWSGHLTPYTVTSTFSLLGTLFQRNIIRCHVKTYQLLDGS